MLEHLRPKSTRYKDHGLLLFSKIGELRARKSFLYSSRGVFKDCIHRVQTLEERLEDLDSLLLNVWLKEFVQEVANKTGGRYLARSL